MANPDQIKGALKTVKKVLKNQKETISPVVESNVDRIEDLEDYQESLEETLDVYFWTLSRASLDNLFEIPEDQPEEEYREKVSQELINLQHEYLVCITLANFLRSL